MVPKLNNVLAIFNDPEHSKHEAPKVARTSSMIVVKVTSLAAQVTIFSNEL
jgi:hypothetical protein